VRQPLPPELVRPFEEFKDIKSIDRIHIAAWIAVGLSVCLFYLDYMRWQDGSLWVERTKTLLFYCHLFGLSFLVPALHMQFNREWIKQTRLRRGIVIWGMVVLTFIFVLGQSIVMFFDRGSLTMFLGFMFIGSWMFAMSHRERILFLAISIGVMGWAILAKDGLSVEERTTHFYEIFFLSLVAFFFDAFDFNLKRANFLNGIELAREQERIRNLEDFKSRFFTNLTHELRTPLTLILGMAAQIREDPRRWAEEGTEVIHRNASQLLHVVNQILDISRIEQGVMPVHYVRADIIGYLGYVTDAFSGQARDRNLTLHYLPRDSVMEIDFDAEKLFVILSNLLSNAIKFTPAGGHVYVDAGVSTGKDGRQVFTLDVRDTGLGIDPTSLGRIFDRFYQAGNRPVDHSSGSGIGLSLVRELALLLGGDVQVHSTAGKGSQFTVTLPVSREAEAPARPLMESLLRERADIQFSTALDHPVQPVAEDDGLPEILVVEDNPDVQRYLQICLDDSYRLILTADGDEAIRLAKDIVPALVLSDVMLPGVDGLAVCRRLKADPVTSHIPILLLSARADAQSRIDGLRSGADVYMVKPFDRDELRAQLHNLMERFGQLQARYAGGQPETAPDVPDVEREDAFVTRVREVILEHLDDNDFTISRLERAVFFSRSQLHKKLKALTGLPASDFIRKIRLDEGRRRLLEQPDSITDVAYQVGFSDPNYFTRCYVRQFGETPSETRNRHNSN